jgi:hypothetical protein
MALWVCSLQSTNTEHSADDYLQIFLMEVYFFHYSFIKVRNGYSVRLVIFLLELESLVASFSCQIAPQSMRIPAKSFSTRGVLEWIRRMTANTLFNISNIQGQRN